MKKTATFITNELYNSNDPENTVIINSTSKRSTTTEPIQLNNGKTLKFQFEPTIAINDKNPRKKISGSLVYKRRPTENIAFPDTGQDIKFTKSSVSNHGWIELHLSSDETYNLFLGLSELYKLSEKINEIPSGTTTYRKVNFREQQFLNLLESKGEWLCNEHILNELISYLTEEKLYENLKFILTKLDSTKIQDINLNINIEAIKRISSRIKSNLDNNNEEFWQSEIFKNNQWILSQIFAPPHVMIADKAFVGGKDINNNKGNICDFIYQNSLSKNTTLIEIKTPAAKLIGRKYRQTFSPSFELTGAINQVLNYRNSFLKNFYCLTNKNLSLKSHSPRCAVVIGRLDTLKEEEIEAFENFRNALSDVLVITFDELHRRLDDLLRILES